MSAIRADNAARDLLARLIDEAELESAPLDEVRADLARLGIDPERAVRFSRRLAAEASAPASDLLAKSFTAEDNDREISDLENADLDAVRAELSATTPLAAAHTQRLANKAISATGRRHPSRRLWYGIGGAITAIAASVLIVVGLTSPELGPRQMALAPDDGAAARFRSMEEQPPAPLVLKQGQSPTTTAMVPPASSKASGEAESAGPTSGAGSSSDVSGLAADDAEVVMRFEGGSSSEAVSSTVGGVPQGVVSVLEYRAAFHAVSAGEEGGMIVSTLLPLRRSLLPDALRSARLPVGDLVRYIERADARHAGDRVIAATTSIAALVTLRRIDGNEFKGVLLRNTRNDSLSAERPAEPIGIGIGATDDTAGEVSDSPVVVGEGGNAEEPSMKLRDLLGADVDKFGFISF